MHKRKIVARLRGGLGNQLFIYAMTRCLAIKNDASLYLDIVSGFKNDGYRRKYLLDHFNIKAEIASPYDAFETGFGFFRRAIQRQVNRFWELNKQSYIIQDRGHFEPQILKFKIRKKVYIDGLWQSERYFKDVEHIIRQDLELIHPRDSETTNMSDKMQEINSVSLHARSYGEVPSSDRNGPEFRMDYYNRAAQYMAQHVDNPHFFCFSDDMDWLRKNVNIEFPVTYMRQGQSHDDNSILNDLWLMSRCKHHIIANSTFSWWGAWLNKNPHKIVITPDIPWNDVDCIPHSWITL